MSNLSFLSGLKRQCCSWLAALCLVGLCGALHADDEPIGRARAASIAQNAFGGKVLSVDEQQQQDEPSAEAEGDDIVPISNVRYVVKLLQNGGRIKVIKLDTTGKIL